MLAIGLAIFSATWGLWLCYLIRYPARWRQHLDRLHVRLKGYGLSIPWMKRAEQGITLKVLVATTTFVTLFCLAIVLRHPQALDTFLHQHPTP
jgi:tellurite resistance protein TehA-like permease